MSTSAVNEARALTVPCPTCKVPVGTPCRRKVYNTSRSDGRTYHLTRDDRAVRAEDRAERRAREQRDDA